MASWKDIITEDFKDFSRTRFARRIPAAVVAGLILLAWGLIAQLIKEWNG